MKKYIVIHFGRNISHFQYFINSSLLKTSERVKDLGIIVDARLKFAEHLIFIQSKCFKIIILIFKNFRIRNFHFYCKLYKICASQCILWSAHIPYEHMFFYKEYRENSKILYKTSL